MFVNRDGVKQHARPRGYVSARIALYVVDRTAPSSHAERAYSISLNISSLDFLHLSMSSDINLFNHSILEEKGRASFQI